MGERETVRRQLKVAFMTMMKGAGCVDDDGREDGLDLEEGGRQQGMHHSRRPDFITQKMVILSSEKKKDGGKL